MLTKICKAYGEFTTLEDVAEAVFGMQRQRVSADYLQTSAVIDADGLVHSAVNDPNLYRGPGTGYRLDGDRWELLQALPHVVDPRRLGGGDDAGAPLVDELGPAEPGEDAAEVVVAVGPAFADAIRETINGLAHRDVLADFDVGNLGMVMEKNGVVAECGSSAAILEHPARSLAAMANQLVPHGEVLRAVCDGVRDGGGIPRLVRVRRTADVAFIAHDGARLSGSGVALGLQSKGTAVIHRADLQPLDNLELFGMSPLYTLESYRAMGRNAAGYALGHRVGPVPTALDNYARAKLIVRTTLLHAQETRAVVPGAPPVELSLVGTPVA